MREITVHEFKKSAAELLHMPIWRRHWMRECECRKRVSGLFVRIARMPALLARPESL